MGVDLFEEIVRNYYVALGYFTMENVCFGPGHAASDIDILAYLPPGSRLHALNQPPVVVVDCKSGRNNILTDHAQEQAVAEFLNQAPISRRTSRMLGAHKAVFKPDWREALIRKVQELTGTRKFDYCFASVVPVDVSRLDQSGIREALCGRGHITSLRADEILKSLESNRSISANSVCHRLAQITSALRKVA